MSLTLSRTLTLPYVTQSESPNASSSLSVQTVLPNISHHSPEDVILAQRHSEIFSLYKPGENGILKLKRNDVDTGLTADTLFKVIKEADKFFSNSESKTTKDGALFTIDNMDFIFKNDSDEQSSKLSSEKKHIFKYSDSVQLGVGSTGTVKKILSISSGKFVPFKIANISKDKKISASENAALTAKHLASIEAEFKNLHCVNQKGQYKYFQHKPITWINIKKVGELPITGFIGQEVYKYDLFSQIENSNKERESLEKEIQEIDIQLQLNKQNQSQIGQNPRPHNENLLSRKKVIMNKFQEMNRNNIILCKQLIEALDEIHKRGFRHGDIKPENILVEQIINSLFLRLADFEGLQPAGLKDEGVPGTAGYSSRSDTVALNYALETDDEKGVLAAFKSRDLFAVAVTIFTILAGHPPYPTGVSFVVDRAPWDKLYDKTLKERGYSSELIALMGKMLPHKFNDRLPFDEAIKQWRQISSLNHSYVKRVSFDAKIAKPAVMPCIKSRFNQMTATSCLSQKAMHSL